MSAKFHQNETNNEFNYCTFIGFDLENFRNHIRSTSEKLSETRPAQLRMPTQIQPSNVWLQRRVSGHPSRSLAPLASLVPSVVLSRPRPLPSLYRPLRL